MPIRIEKETNVISIHTAHTTYQMAVGKYGHLLHLYYGTRVQEDFRYLLTFEDRGFSGNPYEAGQDKTYSLDALPQEYPVYGTGDYRTPACNVRDEKGIHACDFRYESCRILDGKYRIPGLPAVYTDGKAQTLEVVLKDSHHGLCLRLHYGILEDSDVITRAAVFENTGEHRLYLEKAASCCLDFLYGQYDILHFHGRHGMERILERSPLIHGNQVFGSRRGTSSHQQNPFFIIADKNAGEETGECYGISLLYSGNFKAEAEMDQYNQSRIICGISDEMFSYELKHGETFQVPETALCYSREGFGALSRQFHSLIRKHVCRGPYKEKQRPVLINNWEATYFAFTKEKIISIAAQAAELGVEMLVLDDGWFGKRDSDLSGLGDWFVNEEKLGGPLSAVAEQVQTLGLKFGLWIEPEMVSEDSRLYREHPDWAFTIPGRKPVRARYQLVLDFSRKEVVDYISEQIFKVLDAADISYIKMDMNRHITDVCSATMEYQNQGTILHNYVLGVYDFLERLITRYPQMLIEGCGGGGGRFDAGMLYYTPQIWCSDNTDAIERIKIQYGTSFGYPISSVGSHVSAVPNHQTGRSTDLKTRGVVAMAGSFGYELDLNLITVEEKELVKQQIRDYKKYWNLIHKGLYYRLTELFENSAFAAWEFVDEEGAELLLNLVTLDTQCNPPALFVRLKGLDPDGVYQDTDSKVCYRGGALLYAGIPVPRMMGEYQAWQMHLQKL